MNRAQKLISALSITIITVAIALILPRLHAAGTGTLTLTPSSGSYTQNTAFSVNIYEDSGTSTINSVESDLNYDQTKIDCVNVDLSTSDFGVRAYANCGNGKVVIQVGNVGSITGKHFVGKVNFKLIASSGSTDVTFDTSTSKILTDDVPVGKDVWDHNTTGGTYTVKTSTTTGGGGSTGSGGGGTTKTTTKSTTSTSTSTSSSSTTLSSTSATQQEKNPAAPVTASTNQATGLNYMVAIKVLDSKSHIVQDATVTMNHQTTKSDSTGLATFFNVPAGKYTVTVISGKVKGTANISVDGSLPTTQLQQFEVKVKPKYNLTLIAGIAALVVIILIIVIIIKNSGGKFKPVKHPGYEVPKAVIGGTEPTPPTQPTPGNQNNNSTNENLLKPTVITPGKTVGPDPKI